MARQDWPTHHGKPWTKDSFLDALSLHNDRAVAERLFAMNYSNPKAWCYFGIDPGGAIFFHPDGGHHSPLSVLLKSGRLVGRATWSTYKTIKYDERFAEMAEFLGEHYTTSPSPFLFDAYDLDELWAVTMRCAARINGIGDVAHSPSRRSSANVWLEVQHRAREWMSAGASIYTLKRNVRNIITGVTESRIERRSDEGRGEEHAPVTRKMIENLWDALQRDGHTRRLHTLYLGHAILQRAIAGVGYEENPTLSLVLTDAEEANRPFDPSADEVPGLVPTSRTGSGRGGGGGEGPIHAALKHKVKTDPVGAVGERLTYISEDLTERLGDEIPFITGDRVDLLMKDEQGNYVVIEVEPSIGPNEHIGFHQVAKYWVLIAVAKGIDLDRVRRMVVATTIDADLRDHYRRRYGIESAEVSLP